jgi:hypothetical protein
MREAASQFPHARNGLSANSFGEKNTMANNVVFQIGTAETLFNPADRP